MTEVTAATTTQSTQTSPLSAQAEIGEEFNSFLKLLTAQVQNQDPLAPLDSTQFVEQLATFSSLEQEVRSNDHLQTISSSIADLQAMMASQWLGKTVTVESSWVPYVGEAVSFEADIPAGADKAVLTLRDSSGEAVYSQALNPEDGAYLWNGQLQNGNKAANDELYQFAIDIFEQGQHLGSIAPKIITTVTEVGSSNGQLRVGTSSHITADMSDVRNVEE